MSTKRTLQAARRAGWKYGRRGTAWWGALACRAARRVGLDWWLVGLFSVPLDQMMGAGRPLKAYRVRRAGWEDAAALAELFGDAQLVEDRLERGDVCFVAQSSGGIGAGVWMVLGPGRFREDWDQLRSIFHVSRGAAWSYDGRGVRLGAWGSLMAALPGQLHGVGVGEIYTSIDMDNQRSIDSHLGLGYRRRGLVLRIGCGPWGVTLLKPFGRRWQPLPGRIERMRIEPPSPAETSGR
ncbi:MAG TPA: hypothetical protein EYH34_13955 [Planctomycetes bacterium]|nr:hypothetical protein [Planctomycetota bacterium]